MYAPSLVFGGVRLLMTCVYFGLVNLLGLGFTLSTFCRDVFVHRYFLNLVLFDWYDLDLSCRSLLELGSNAWQQGRQCGGTG